MSHRACPRSPLRHSPRRARRCSSPATLAGRDKLVRMERRRARRRHRRRARRLRSLRRDPEGRRHRRRRAALDRRHGPTSSSSATSSIAATTRGRRSIWCGGSSGEAQAAGGACAPAARQPRGRRACSATCASSAPGEYAAFASADSESHARELPEDACRHRRAIATEFDQQMPLGFVEMRQAFGRDGEYGRGSAQLPVGHQDQRPACSSTAASVPPVAPLGCDGDQRSGAARADRAISRRRAPTPLASLTARADGPLWYRGLAQEPDTFAPQVDRDPGQAARARHRHRATR